MLDEGVDIERSAGPVEAIAFPARPAKPAASPVTAVPLNPGPAVAPNVSFDRHELGAILRVYGRMVAAGEWRDYAIDHLKESAVFSIFRRTSEMPLYRIVKDPKLARRQGAYSVVAQGGLILKRGHELDPVLRVFDRHLKLVEA